MASKPKSPLIKDFRHRVHLCSQKDVVLDSDMLRLSRTDVYACWANIVASKGSMFSSEGYNLDKKPVRTHKLTIRYNRNVDFTQAAWFYEERLQSGARWYKALGWTELEERGLYLVFDVRLVDRGFEAIEPTAPVATDHGPLAAVPLPGGVRL